MSLEALTISPEIENRITLVEQMKTKIERAMELRPERILVASFVPPETLHINCESGLFREERPGCLPSLFGVKAKTVEEPDKYSAILLRRHHRQVFTEGIFLTGHEAIYRKERLVTTITADNNLRSEPVTLEDRPATVDELERFMKYIPTFEEEETDKPKHYF